MRPEEDAYGRALLDMVEGVPATEIVERDDGYIEQGGGPQSHLAPYSKWSSVERRGLRWVRGRVLDAGAGTGRVAFHLQEKGLDVVAVDISPLAVEAAKQRGVKDARVVAIEEIDESFGRFDTILMYGNNLALLGPPAKAKRLLRRFHGLTSERGRIVGGSLDPHVTNAEDHLAYHARNRGRGRMAGELRVRIRYRRLQTPWIQLLFVSPEELETLLPGTGWRLLRVLRDGGPLFVAVLEKER